MLSSVHNIPIIFAFRKSNLVVQTIGKLMKYKLNHTAHAKILFSM